MVQDIDTLGPELAWCQAFHLDEGTELQLHVMLAHDIIIRRFLR
jgi:hypothetical protein